MHDQSRVMLKLGKHAVGRRLATDILSSDGKLLARAGTVLTDDVTNFLLSEGISTILSEPNTQSRVRETLDQMFERHKGDVFMEKLHETALRLTADTTER
ncbi:MAG: hypothetical protein JW909_12465 [Planctomycetes bacterium]|nr:hypothetical protein [Planctomycetota bacterium]